MIVIVAPYSPSDRLAPAHLGAARKIEAVISILSRTNESLVLVNTSHDLMRKNNIDISRSKIANIDLWEITPPIASNRRLGKFLNILQVPSVLRSLEGLGKPSLVWLYNGYAFESRFGRLAKQNFKCPIILEMEDWHFSRDRGINPKPVIDWLFWLALMPHVSYSFAVNSSLGDRVGGLGENVGIFPGVVADGVDDINKIPPFQRGDDVLTVGYFGGLSHEKGAGHVLAMVDLLPSTIRIVVTGSGELEEDFRNLAATSGNKLSFHGRVDDAKLLELISSCDVLLNPHAPIDFMANGIFPFKVIEGIASGRLMISTPLPSSGLENVLQGISFIKHDVQELTFAVINARTTYVKNFESIRQGAHEANRLFSKEAILSVVNRLCK